MQYASICINMLRELILHDLNTKHRARTPKLPSSIPILLTSSKILPLTVNPGPHELSYEKSLL